MTIRPAFDGDCPLCCTTMLDLEELVPATLHDDVQEWPSVYWCPHCGVLWALHNQPRVPELTLLQRPPDSL